MDFPLTKQLKQVQVINVLFFDVIQSNKNFLPLHEIVVHWCLSHLTDDVHLVKIIKTTYHYQYVDVLLPKTKFCFASSDIPNTFVLILLLLLVVVVYLKHHVDQSILHIFKKVKAKKQQQKKKSQYDDDEEYEFPYNSENNNHH
jgi:hypothetical protein